MSQKVIKTGNSLAVTIPSNFAKAVGIKAGDTVELEKEADKGRLSYVFAGAKQLPLSENFLKTKKK